MDESDSEHEKQKVNERSSSESSYEDEVPIPSEETTTKPAQQKVEGKLDDVETLQDKMTSVISQLQPKPRRKKFVPKYDVPGVFTLTLGEETQIQIDLVIGQHVNAQYPWKLVSKDKIIEAIDVGGELSEFYPLREELSAYDEAEVLMGYIVDESKDVDEFYLCCTVEARDHCKQQSDKFIRRQEKKLEKAVQKKPRPWKSLGSENELKELTPINTRPLMEMEIRSKFPKVYEPLKLEVRNSDSVRDGYIELTPYRQKFNFVLRRRVDSGIQAGPATAERSAQTLLKYPQNIWTQATVDPPEPSADIDGGGDAGRGVLSEGGKQETKSSDEDEEEDKGQQEEVGMVAYQAAINRMRRASYVKNLNDFISKTQSEMDSIVVLNTVMDMYCNDYPNLISSKSVGIYDSMTFEEYVCFTDVRAKDKYVSCAVFHPMWTGIVAISYADGSPAVMKTVSHRPDPIQRAVYGLNPVMIWSHIDSLMPKLYLESPREVKVLSFCPFDENILVGGCINGQIVVWDITNKLENVERIEVLSETREKYRIAMNAHMGWMKTVQDNAVVQSTVLSNLMTCHYGPVTVIKWLSPNFIVTPTGKTVMMPNKKHSIMFCTASEDGNILFWNLSVENTTQFEGKKVKKSKRVLRRPSGLLVDVSPLKILDRNLQPCYKLILGRAGQPQTLPVQSFAMSPPKINYSYTPRNPGSGRKYFTCEIVTQSENEIDTILYCGSQHGEMRRVTWEGHEFNTGEVVNSEYSDIKYSCCIHDGIVTRTTKNPFLNNLTVTIGGKIFAIWSDKLTNRPLIWKKRPCRLTDARWSLYKPSMLFIATSEGDVETWDLLLRSDQPISIQTLSGTMLTGVTLHTLPLAKNIIGVSDINGSFKMFLDPPIFMIENPSYIGRMESTILRELKVMTSFLSWQDEWMKNNPHLLVEMKRKEAAILLEKEEEKRRLKEEEDRRLEEEAEARRLAKMKVIGPEERWQKIIQKLIERTIAVKKRINRAELIEHEKPLRELEAQRLEKERRMLEIMKNQKTIFNDTVAILFPEAIKKKEKAKKSYLDDDKGGLKKQYLEDYEFLKKNSFRMVKENPYKVKFSWEGTVAEGKERRDALSTHDNFIKMHKMRIFEDKDKDSSESLRALSQFAGEEAEIEKE